MLLLWELSEGFGFNTDVLGRIVEVVSGTDLETFLQTNIFKPLGMTKTSF